MTKITGTMIYYYFVCKRKLWCFSNQIRLEDESENVLIGKLIDENSYIRENKQIMIDETVNVDFIKDWSTLHEVKKSNSIEDATIWQVKYYLYFLQKKGLKINSGIIDYPRIKRRKEVELGDGDNERIERILWEIEEIISDENIPEAIDSKICKSCAYYEYCYV